jgi:hypothetical protein
MRDAFYGKDLLERNAEVLIIDHDQLTVEAPA